MRLINADKLIERIKNSKNINNGSAMTKEECAADFALDLVIVYIEEMAVKEEAKCDQE